MIKHHMLEQRLSVLVDFRKQSFCFHGEKAVEKEEEEII